MRGLRTVALGAALALGAVLLGCAATPLHTRPWIEASTPTFTILSPMSEAETLALVRELELFRSVVERVTGAPIPPSPVPLRIYAFDGPSTYRHYGMPGIAGYFAPSMRQGTIVVGDASSTGGSAKEVLRHEYVHFLVRNHGHYAYPPWYNEGLAEFLSNVQVSDDGVVVGWPLRSRVAVLRSAPWIPLERLMALRSFSGMAGDQVAAFYSQAWLLVHYLYLGRDEADARAQLTRYLDALRRGARDAEAVREGFGADTGGLGHRLLRYVESGRYPYVTVPFEKLGPGAAPRLRHPPKLEVARSLGWLSLTLERFEQAQRQYQAALVAHPGDARATAGLAHALAGQERWQEADALYAEALALGVGDAVVQLDYANYLHARAERAEDAAARADLAERARRHYVQSWKLDGTIPETYAAYGSTFLLEGQDAERGLATLEQARRMLPSSPDILLSLARLYAEIGRRGEARELARVVSTWSHSDEIEDAIQELLDGTDPDRAADEM